MSYEPHDSLIRPARMSANPLRLIVGFMLIVVIYLSVALLFFQTLAIILGEKPFRLLLQTDTPPNVLYLLFEFAFLILALSMVLRTVHRRDLLTLVGRKDRAANQFLRCSIYLLPLFFLFFLMPMPENLQVTPSLPFWQWLLWLPLAVPMVLVQVGAEELIFRGYLQSQIAARFRHPIIWIGLPSLLFGWLHYSPAMAGENAWMLVVWATVFGASAADLTARSGTLGPAIALHFINNVFAILIAAPLGDLDALALFTFPLSLDEPGIVSVVLPLEIMFTFCAWLAARLALRV